MSSLCPFCAHENPPDVLVCSACARDIVIPPSLIAERDDLLRKRDAARDELARNRAELGRLKLKSSAKRSLF
jgi:hypothetical protein